MVLGLILRGAFDTKLTLHPGGVRILKVEMCYVRILEEQFSSIIRECLPRRKAPVTGQRGQLGS